jgi:NAD(P)-dependent dehydrogenase (short-subunit alcohol dehydrogenase family)
MPDTHIALVTGATAGLGRAVAIALAERGMHVLVHGRDAARAAAVVTQIVKSGGSAEVVLADLASLEQARKLADQVNAEHHSSSADQVVVRSPAALCPLRIGVADRVRERASETHQGPGTPGQ